ncbi:MAG: hypothetical protein IPK82_19555 [Polyangiaceae bacterium]|nr:hypothetical protein [Polyangiaceae bacterium]
MSRAGARAAAFILCFASMTAALADDAPDPAKVKRAAEEFDLGVAAFKAKEFEEAAQHFEAADEAVPGAKTLRLAIRARVEAGHGSRAATLAAQALERYPGDGDTTSMANETIAKFGSKLHRVNVSCASPCLLALGTRAVHGARATRWVVYVDPGKTSINASFWGDATAKPKSFEASAGGTSEFRFEPPEPIKPVSTAPTGTSTSSAAGSAPLPTAEPTGEPTEPPPPKGIHPAFFGIGAGLTAAAGGVLIWSGIDTLQNPGTAKVRELCAGKGPDCPEYKVGLQSQLRTNILIGATAGVGAVTVVLAIFTRFKSAPEQPKSAFISPTVNISDRGAHFGVTGAF